MQKTVCESELTQAFARGDEHALEILWGRYGKSIWKWLSFKVGYDYDMASDLAQQVLIQTWESRHRFDPNRPIRAWLWGIAGKVWQKHYRREQKGIVVYVEDIETIEATLSSHEDNVSNDEASAEDRPISRKKLKPRDVLVQETWVGLILKGRVKGMRPPNEAISRELGLSIDKVRGSTSRVMKAMKSEGVVGRLRKREEVV